MEFTGSDHPSSRQGGIGAVSLSNREPGPGVPASRNDAGTTGLPKPEVNGGGSPAGFTADFRVLIFEFRIYDRAMPENPEQLERVRERFTRTAEPFAQFVLSKRSGQAEALAHEATRGLRDASEAQALDVACGPGTLACAMAPRVRTVCGLDLTPAMLRQARAAGTERGLANLRFVCGEAERQPWPDASFDLAVCGYSIHHFSDPERILVEVRRLLRPGGRLGLVDLIVPSGGSAEADRRRIEANTEIERARDASHTRTLLAEELRRLTESAGFRVLGSELEKHPRSFDDWMEVGGWKPGDAAYATTRRLMEASMPGDTAGFHPRLVSNVGSSEEPVLEYDQTSIRLVAERR